MKRGLFVVVLLSIMTACSSDDADDPCATLQPVELKQGEGRLFMSWQDITEGQVIEKYEFQVVLPGDEPGNSWASTNPVTLSSSPDTKFHFGRFKSLPYDVALELYYRASCDGATGETLGPIGVRSLAFGEGCTPPAELELVEVTTTTATFNWEGFDEELWSISWGANDGMDGGDEDVTEPTYTITGLRPGISYLVGVMARCTGTDFVTSELDLNPTQTITTLEE